MKRRANDMDLEWMRAALREAERGGGRTHPNPAVGAVIVAGGRVVGSGYHERAGMPHAEARAIAAAGPRARGATLYTTLEPCDHFGRTPPCTQAILDADLAELVYGSSDPNPVVNGRGLRRLRARGVRVVGPVLGAECDALNRPFFKFMQGGLPWTTLKAAITLDGKIATGSGASRWITSPEARRRAHELRNRVDAIVVGAGTVIADDPALTTRLDQPGTRDPVRVVVDPRLQTSPTARVYAPGGARAVAVASLASARRRAAFRRAGVELWDDIPAPGGRVDLHALARRLAGEGLLHVALEGGAGLFGSYLEAGLVDDVVLFVAPKLFGHAGLTWSGALDVSSPDSACRLEGLSAESVGADLILTARLCR